MTRITIATIANLIIIITFTIFTSSSAAAALLRCDPDAPTDIPNCKQLLQPNPFAPTSAIIHHEQTDLSRTKQASVNVRGSILTTTPEDEIADTTSEDIDMQNITAPYGISAVSDLKYKDTSTTTTESWYIFGPWVAPATFGILCYSVASLILLGLMWSRSWVDNSLCPTAKFLWGWGCRQPRTNMEFRYSRHNRGTNEMAPRQTYERIEVELRRLGI